MATMAMSKLWRRVSARGPWCNLNLAASANIRARAFSLFLCKGHNTHIANNGISNQWCCSRWDMQLPPHWMMPSLRFSTESQQKKKKKKKKKKKSKRDIIKKLKHLRHVTKIKKSNMDYEQKLLARIERAKTKIDALQKALEAYELPPLPPAEHDPESLTAEELHYLKRLGYKHKNYMLIGVRGVFGGVVLNMHLHWKKHQLVKIRCKNYTRAEIEETGKQLARLSGGIVVDVQKGDTIVMYRGRNYTRPAELTPKNTLSKRKALIKAKFEQSLKSVNKNLLDLEKELVLYREHKAKQEAGIHSVEPNKSYLSSWSDSDDEHASDSEEVKIDGEHAPDSEEFADDESSNSEEAQIYTESDEDTDAEIRYDLEENKANVSVKSNWDLDANKQLTETNASSSWSSDDDDDGTLHHYKSDEVDESYTSWSSDDDVRDVLDIDSKTSSGSGENKRAT